MFDWRKPMWTDNPLQKSWEELGFNEYEARHCCFDSDGGTDGGADGQDGGLNADDTSGSVTGTDASTDAEGQEMDDFDEYNEAYADEHSVSMGNPNATEGVQGEEAGLKSVYDPKTGKEHGQVRDLDFWGDMDVNERPYETDWGGMFTDALIGLFKGVIATAFPPAGIGFAAYDLATAKTKGEALSAALGIAGIVPGNIGRGFRSASSVLGAVNTVSKAGETAADLLGQNPVSDFVDQTGNQIAEAFGWNTPNPYAMSNDLNLGIHGPNHPGVNNTNVAGQPSGGYASTTGGGSGAGDPFGGAGGGDSHVAAIGNQVTGRQEVGVPTRTSTPLMKTTVGESMPLSETSFGRTAGRDLPYGVVSPFAGITDELDSASIGSTYGSPRAGRMKAAA